MKSDTQHFGKILSFSAAFLLFAVFTNAAPQVDGVSHDPAFISAGDEVTISVNLRETDHPEKNWDEDKTLKAVLEPDNRLAREHSVIVDDMDRSIGFLYPDGVWNQNYEVKFDSDAPTGNYGYRVLIQYLEDGEPIDITRENGTTTTTYVERFNVDVDRKGVEISSTVQQTDPVNLRPGYNYATSTVAITNTGNKPVENIELHPDTPEMITPAYSKDEKFLIGKLNPGETFTLDMDLNIDEDIQPGRHVIEFNSVYEDTDSNEYSQILEAPIRIEGRPDLELEQVSNIMSAGESGDFRLKVTNTGSHTAEGVTSRVLLEREQPFILETRSDYIGDIEPGETSESVLELGSDRSATLKEHQLRIQLRATGDSEEGDNSVYTFTEHQTVELVDRARSPLIYIGLIGAVAVLLVAGLHYRRSRESEEDQ